MAAQNETAKQESATAKGRGPSYPIMSLRSAVDRVEKLFKAEGRSLTHTSVAVVLWGYSEKSSGGRQLIATLIQYGLLRDEGSGDQRSIGVSNLALEILLHEDGSAERYQALRTAARSPKLFSDILANYAVSGLPSDATLKRFLIMERNVTADAADGVVKNFRDTISFAKLLDPEQKKAEDKGDAGGQQKPDGQKLQAQEGDLVQWEAGGVLQFEQPRRVRAVTDHEGASWVFVEGSTTGIPMNETSVIERPVKPAQTPPELPEVTATRSLQAGEREWARGTLAKDVIYRLLVNGELGPREIGKLIKLLEAQKAVLADDEDAA